MDIIRTGIETTLNEPLCQSDPEVRKNAAQLADAAEALAGFLGMLRWEGLPSANSDARARLRHDLRSQINLILGYSELVEEDFQAAGLTSIGDCLRAMQISCRDLVISVYALVDVDAPPDQAAQKETWDSVAPLANAPLARALTGHILLVDDSAAMRELAQHYLTSHGHKVSQANSGQEALAFPELASVDLILLDMIMPGLSGLQVLERLKASEQYWNIPVIVLSGLTDINAVAPCIAAGADDYLPKPFNPVLLRARIQNALMKKLYADREVRHLREIEAQKAKSDNILQAVLPASIVRRLKNDEYPIADRRADVTVLFADIVGFTKLAGTLEPVALVGRLDRLFSVFDAAATKYGVEKIKTIGDAYMACCGVSDQHADHADRCAALAYEMIRQAGNDHEIPLDLRIGLHSGPVIAGLIGQNRYAFDVWGETVNFASRVELAAPVGAICGSSRTIAALGTDWVGRSVGEIELRGIGREELFVINRTGGTFE